MKIYYFIFFLYIFNKTIITIPQQKLFFFLYEKLFKNKDEINLKVVEINSILLISNNVIFLIYSFFIEKIIKNFKKKTLFLLPFLSKSINIIFSLCSIIYEIPIIYIIIINILSSLLGDDILFYTVINMILKNEKFGENVSYNQNINNNISISVNISFLLSYVYTDVICSQFDIFWSFIFVIIVNFLSIAIVLFIFCIKNENFIKQKNSKSLFQFLKELNFKKEKKTLILFILHLTPVLIPVYDKIIFLEIKYYFGLKTYIYYKYFEIIYSFLINLIIKKILKSISNENGINKILIVCQIFTILSHGLMVFTNEKYFFIFNSLLSLFSIQTNNIYKTKIMGNDKPDAYIFFYNLIYNIGGMFNSFFYLKVYKVFFDGITIYCVMFITQFYINILTIVFVY